MQFIKTSATLLSSLFFGAVMVIPLLGKNLLVKESSIQGTNIPYEISITLWQYRLPDIYLHALFLATTIIASLVALRKPPRFVRKDEQEVYIPPHARGYEEGGHE